MSIVVVIETPIATERDGTYNISVEAVAMEKEVEIARQTFSTTISEVGNALTDMKAGVVYDWVANTLAIQIIQWQKGLTRLAEFTPNLVEIKKMIEGRLD